MSLMVCSSKKCRKVIGCLILGLITIHIVLNFGQYPPAQMYLGGLEAETLSSVDHSNSNSTSMDYIVNTPSCKIVNINEWDDRIIPYFHPVQYDDLKWPFDCHERSRRHWTYIENSNIVINESALYETGFSLDTISCCYRGIERIENNAMELKIVRFTDNCYPMTKPSTFSQHEFIRVICQSRGFPVPDSILYKQFHPIASSTVVSSNKVQHWKRAVEKPPNIIIIGIDAMSRLNFKRTMVKTYRKLQEFGAVEMFGYTKVGESTFPNVGAVLSGYDMNTLLSLCHSGGPFSNELGTEDMCPYLWKEFHTANYSTALIEDRVHWAFANLNGNGFIRKPTDFYFKPFMLGVYNHQPYYQMKFVQKPNAIDCIGHKTADQVMLEYIQGLMNLTVPTFVFSWNTNLAHEDMTAPINVDHLYHKFLVEQDTKLKNNTVLIFMSDHGARYGPFRETLHGRQDEKLPNLWIYLSPEVRMKMPEWQANLVQNSRKVTSAYDLHHTLIHILETFTNHRISSMHKKTYGISLLSDSISETRNCPEAGVPHSYCVCFPTSQISIDDNRILLTLATRESLDVLNEQLKLKSKECVPLKLDRITQAAILEDNFVKKEITTYLITFFAVPGQILIEISVRYNMETRAFENKTEPSRINRMSRSTDCVQDNRLEKFCYCP